MTDTVRPIRHVGIIGAGTMGRAIAKLSARAGMHVQVFDEDRTTAMNAVAAIAAESASTVSLLSHNEQFATLDLVVEAVPEDHALKTSIFRRIEPYLTEDAVLASNTSSLSIGRMAEALEKPDRFCGLHFCHPVDRRQLVEIVACEKTGACTVDRIFRFATDIGKSPLVVPDSPGFVLNRLLVPYMNEALELLLDGASVESLDRAAKSFGMPIRPLALYDEFGFDVALAVGGSLYQAYPDRVAASELLIAMYKTGRRGRKRNGGFYRNADEAAKGHVDPAVLDLIHQRRRHDKIVPDDVVNKRLFLPMLIEATCVLEESLVSDPGAIDLTLERGLGLQNAYGGLMAWGNAVGTKKIVEWLHPFRKLGPRFQPTRLLLDAARHNAPISGRRPAAA